MVKTRNNTKKIVDQLEATLSLDERVELLARLAHRVTKEVMDKQLLPPGPIAHAHNVRHAANELNRVMSMRQTYTHDASYDEAKDMAGI